jgi:hypothetical protein
MDHGLTAAILLRRVLTCIGDPAPVDLGVAAAACSRRS